MADAVWRVAIIDSGLDPQSGIVPLACRRFVDDGQRVAECEAGADPTGHGTAIAEIISEARADLLIAQVMQGSAATTPAAVAAAVHWSISRGVRLIHLSLGVAQDRPVLGAAISEALTSGVIVVAAVPARGTPSFPAAYPGVLRATGDARCAASEVSLLEDMPLTFGACAAFTTSAGRLMRGASIGAANLTRCIVSKLSPGVDTDSLAAQLSTLADYRGRERISHASEIVNKWTDSNELSGS